MYNRTMEEIDRIEEAERFTRIRVRALWNALFAFLEGRPNRLLSWDEVRDKLDLHDQVARGIQVVPIEQIIGSVNRYQDFDRAFLPQHDRMRDKWQSVAEAFNSGVALPPVELYKAGDVYFVSDGHHRISVARDLGIQFVEAHVVEVKARVPIAADLDAGSLELKSEQARFIQRTRLDELRPTQRIELTTRGSYDRMLEHIAAHHRSLEAKQGRAVPWDEAICDWYDNLYLPIVGMIREKEILTGFPQRTEADLYLWITDHQHSLREQCGPEVDVERAAEHYAARYTARPVKRMLSALQELISGLDCELLIGERSRQEAYTA